MEIKNIIREDNYTQFINDVSVIFKHKADSLTEYQSVTLEIFEEPIMVLSINEFEVYLDESFHHTYVGECGDIGLDINASIESFSMMGDNVVNKEILRIYLEAIEINQENKKQKI